MVSFFSAIYANIIFCDCYNSLKQNFINEFKNKAKKADGDAINKVKWLVNDVNTVISNTFIINTDEFLNADLYFLGASKEAKQKLKGIFKKNKQNIKDNAKYRNNSVYYCFDIKSDKINSFGIIEFNINYIKK